MPLGKRAGWLTDGKSIWRESMKLSCVDDSRSVSMPGLSFEAVTSPNTENPTNSRVMPQRLCVETHTRGSFTKEKLWLDVQIRLIG